MVALIISLRPSPVITHDANVILFLNNQVFYEDVETKSEKSFVHSDSLTLKFNYSSICYLEGKETSDGKSF